MLNQDIRWQDPSQKTIITQDGKPIGYSQMTITSTAQPLSGPATQANKCIIQIEATGNVRWRDDGTAPTSTVGMLLYAGNAIEFDADQSVSNVQFILASDTVANVILNVSFYQKG
jgi:hypothetical protein